MKRGEGTAELIEMLLCERLYKLPGPGSLEDQDPYKMYFFVAVWNIRADIEDARAKKEDARRKRKDLNRRRRGR